MKNNISAFSNYESDENRITNALMYVLQQVYYENVSYFSELINTLSSDEEIGNSIGVTFKLQEKKSSQLNKKNQSIPDGSITQKSLKIFIETKIGDNFDQNQILQHLVKLKSESSDIKRLLLIGNVNDNLLNSAKFPKLRDKKELITVVSFERIIETLESIDGLSNHLKQLITELRNYFETNNLLPQWKDILDVVNCAKSTAEIKKYKIYTCPARGGHYQHKRAKYFGIYGNKKVGEIDEILGVVDLLNGNEPHLLWNNTEKPNGEIIEMAKERYSKLTSKGETVMKHNEQSDIRVFVLGEIEETNYQKTSPRGMFGSKRYFDPSQYKDLSIDKIANKLMDEKWQ